MAGAPPRGPPLTRRTVLANPNAIAAGLAARAQAQGALAGPGSSPLTASYNQWVAGSPVGGAALPAPFYDFLAGAFGPLSPIQPMPVDVVPRDDEGRPLPRRWQYPVGWNLPVGQPGTEGYRLASYATLRRLADGYSVIRAMLNIRKNEMSGLNWDVGATGDAQSRTKGDKGAAKDQRSRAAEVVRWFKRIDSNYFGFQSWFEAGQEDQLVIDAVTLHPLPTRVKGKGLFGCGVAELELINGETIRPLVNIRGASPRFPEVAYQQYLWGVPRSDFAAMARDEDVEELAVDYGLDGVEPDAEYTRRELLYLPRNQRTWTPYGFSPIEMALIPVTIGIQRQGFLLDYFTDGTIPGVYVIAGESYVTPSQQRGLQDLINGIAGDVGQKHRAIVLPPGSKTEPQKDMTFQQAVDQAIVEQVAMILHIQPHEIGMVPGGRTSGLGGAGMAQVQQDSVVESRTEPERKWWKGKFDWLIQEVMGQEDLEWKWLDFEEEQDAEQKANADKADVSIGKRSIDEQRIDDGLDPWDLPLTKTPFVIGGPSGIIPLDPSVPPPAAPAPAGPGGAPGPGGSPAQGALAEALKPDGKDASKPRHDPAAALLSDKKKDRRKGRKELADRFADNLKDAVKDKPAVLGGAAGPGAALEPSSAGEGADKAKGATVADLMKWRTRYNDSKLPRIVHDYLLRSYPKGDIDWSEDPAIAWEFDPHVKLSDIDMARRPGGRDPSKVSAIADTVGKGASMDPVVLVEYETPDEAGLNIADGWHRTLGAEKAGEDEVPAFVGRGVPDKYRDLIDGRMQDDSGSKKKAALAELSVLGRYVRKHGSAEGFEARAMDPDVVRLFKAETARGETGPALERARRRVLKEGGNPQALRDWYNAGADGQIDWGSDGDFDQCVSVASNYMSDEDARGFCNLRHQDAVGGAPGTEKNFSVGSPLASGLAPYDLDTGERPAIGPRCTSCGAALFPGSADYGDGRCADCQISEDVQRRSPGEPMFNDSAPAVLLRAIEAELTRRGVDLAKWNPDQPRDDRGRWTAGGGPSGEVPVVQDTRKIGDFPQEVQDAARSVTARAAAAEPRVTADMAHIASATGGNLNERFTGPDGKEHGTLDAVLKSDSSTARKIADDIRDKGYTTAQSAAQVYDALRYTVTYPAGEYAKGAERAMDDLKAAGYEPLRGKDFWSDASQGYAGVNTVWGDPRTGQSFEVQFHTPEALQYKEGVGHPVYEAWRAQPEGSAARAYYDSKVNEAWQPIRDAVPYLDALKDFMTGMFPPRN